jgi:hypothetical protein
MSNPAIPQGSLNRLQASVFYGANPLLNVIAAFLTPDGIDIALEGEVSQLIPTMIGAVPSPEPYQFATVTIHLVRSQGMASIYKNQIETNSNVGSVTVVPDTLALTPYQFNNCVLSSVQPIKLNGKDAGWVVTIKGTYSINSALFLAA